MQTFLEVTRGPDLGAVIPVTARPRVWGRASGLLQDPSVSRRQAKCWQGRRGVRLEVCPGAAPLRYRGRRLRPGCAVRLAAGRRLRVGATVLALRTRAPAPLRSGPPPWLSHALRLLVPVALFLVLVPLLFGRRSPLPLALAALGVLALGGGGGWLWHQRTPPRPGRLRQAPPAAPRPGRSIVLHTRACRAARPASRVPTHLSVRAGQVLQTTGPHRRALGLWLAAQAHANGLTVQLRPGPTATALPATPGVVIYTEPPPSAEACVVVEASGPLPGADWLAHAEDRWLAGSPPPGRPCHAHELIPLSRADITHRWAAPSFRLPLGRTEAGTNQLVDLVHDGPHALIAGRTGAGKSELLAYWLLALAVHASPQDLVFILVDYKGGAGLRPVARLPHTATLLTDLDPAATSRALQALRAEVARRERVLTAAGAPDIAALQRLPGEQASLPRLVIAVDEFRVLADHHRDVLDSLVRLAAQGRSLGVHLLLATQRPAGAISPDIAANTALRVCLRVSQEADSTDVLGAPAAAHLPAAPGHGFIRTDELVQIRTPALGTWADQAIALADELAAGRPAPTRPWAEPLPDSLPVGRAPLPAPATAGVGIVVVDDIDAQAWTAHGLGDQPLAILGAPRTGRTTAILTCASAALAAGRSVDIVTANPQPFQQLLGGHGGLGTLARWDDARHWQALVQRIGQAPSAAVLLLDGIPAPPCAALDVEELMGAAGAAGVQLILSADTRPARWHAACQRILALGGGVLDCLPAPARRVPVRPRPGHGIYRHADQWWPALVPHPTEPPPPWTGPPPPRLLPVPPHADAALLTAASGPDRLVFGHGAAGAVVGECGDVLIIGLPSTGRSTLLAHLARQARAAGCQPLVCDDHDLLGPAARAELANAPGHPVLAVTTPDDALTLTRGPLGRARTHGTLVVTAGAHRVVRALIGLDPGPPLPGAWGALVVTGRSVVPLRLQGPLSLQKGTGGRVEDTAGQQHVEQHPGY
ncbi:FHA domain-containing protein [Buchananella hordeovulneris]|uniref:FtsK domain-containing protein n=1 Tax=Buchananella hordeovulneris TaxID=52770 RepID=A0A1Q5PW32_9ACTO|nr:FHA domain-containing protein [Buchananella hordeovulneris]OKL51811.1 hypothetical protein BSZ40_04810 [Buchananella hordeovulneris]